MIVVIRAKLGNTGPMIDPVALGKFVRGDEKMSPMLRSAVAQVIREDENHFREFLVMLAEAQRDDEQKK